MLVNAHYDSVSTGYGMYAIPEEDTGLRKKVLPTMECPWFRYCRSSSRLRGRKEAGTRESREDWLHCLITARRTTWYVMVMFEGYWSVEGIG